MTRARRWIVAVVAAGAVGLPSCTGSVDHLVTDCTRRDLQGRSVARVWDEALLDAIRRDVPAPTVHARNLFHTSAAMWDAWAAYDPQADGYFVHEKLQTDDVRAARETAISYAAYRLLLWRYSRAAGLQETFDELADTMRSLCYRIDYVSTEGDSPAALGNRIAAAAIAYGTRDGSLEDQRYVDTDYRPVNAPLVVAEPGAPMTDPNRWQPLALAQIVAQNGLPIPGNVQRFVGPHWGHVKAFALPPSADGTPIDPGPPPRLGETDAAFERAAVEVIRDSSYLDPSDGVQIDIGPASSATTPWARTTGTGTISTRRRGSRTYRTWCSAATTRAPWRSSGRTARHRRPPGHWNTVANDVSDSPGFRFRIGGTGPEVDRLEWDVKLYFALNGAVHDAAVAAWGLEGSSNSVRPISMIRYMAGLGRSSDPDAP